jgi:hypothetical protein
MKGCEFATISALVGLEPATIENGVAEQANMEKNVARDTTKLEQAEARVIRSPQPRVFHP